MCKVVSNPPYQVEVSTGLVIYQAKCISYVDPSIERTKGRVATSMKRCGHSVFKQIGPDQCNQLLFKKASRNKNDTTITLVLEKSQDRIVFSKKTKWDKFFFRHTSFQPEPNYAQLIPFGQYAQLQRQRIRHVQ